jgi:hypothetical protein
MTPQTIVLKKINPEGFPVSQEVLEASVRYRFSRGMDYVFRYGQVVLTVDKQTGMVHLYADESRGKLLRALSRFHQDVWKRTQLSQLIAPILNRTVMKLAERYGWQMVGMAATGHCMYKLERRGK